MMLCQFLLYSKVTQSHTHTHIYIHSLSYIIFYHSLSQETENRSLCYIVEPHCLSILNVIVYFYKPQTLSPSHSLSLGNHKSVLHVCESVSVV